MEQDPARSDPTGLDWVIRQFLLFVTAIWTGCFISAVAMLIGMACIEDAGDVSYSMKLIWMPPILMANFLIIPNLISISFSVWFFFISDFFSLRGWGLFSCFQSLMAMCSVGYYVHRWPAIWIAWGAWLVLCLMSSTALWFVHQWQMNKWAAEIAILQAENATRIAERQRSGEISEHSPD